MAAAPVSATSLRLSSVSFQLLLPISSTTLVNARNCGSRLASPPGWKTSNLDILKQKTSRLQISCAAAKPETVDKVCSIVRKQLVLPPETKLSGDSKFTALGADSLDTVEIVMGLEEEFGISVEEESSQNITSIQEAADLIEKLVEKKAGA